MTGDKDLITGLTKEQLLAEIEDVIRAMPDPDNLHSNSPEILSWLGRAGAAINNWSKPMAIEWNSAVTVLRSGRLQGDGKARVIMLLHQAQNDLRMKTTGPVNAAIGHGYVFDYLDTMRKIIGQAKTDIMFVDRYLNGDFVSQFLPLVGAGVSIRLLSRRARNTETSLGALISMSQAFSNQHDTRIEIRTSSEHHQRYVFLDRASGYESGSSFKDGPLTAGTTIKELDGSIFTELLGIHESLWQDGTVELST